MESAMIPYFAHEGEMCRMERTNKRLWILILVLIVALIGSNVGWLIYESQFETVDIAQEVETGSAPAVISGMGDAVYGYDTSTDNGQGEEIELHEALP